MIASTFVRWMTASLIALPIVSVLALGSDLNLPPINYEKATPENTITRFQKDLASGKAKLTHADERGYLKSVLAALQVPESSLK